MSKLTERLKKLSIHNPHNFVAVGGGKVLVYYLPDIPGRGGIGHISGYRVSGIGFQVEPDGFWLLY